MTDDFIQLLNDRDENKPEPQEEQLPPWIVGIIDDEPSVHDATKLALKNISLYGRKLEFHSAYSGKEGFEMVQNNPDMALILLDVVMETDDAGLLLVDRIRGELNNQLLQIVLRTGQAGYAPEEDVIIRYEINSYKNKSELTRNKLFTTLATGLRSYQMLQAIEQSRNGLRAVISASASLIQERSVFEFSSGVLQQIDALFGLSADSLFCVSQRPTSGPIAIRSDKNATGYYIVAANDKFQQYFGKNIEDLKGEVPQMGMVFDALNNERHVFSNGSNCLYLSTPSGWKGVIVAENSSSLKNADEELLQIFCMNVALGLENAKFFSYLNKAAFQDELTGLNNRTGLLEKVSKSSNSNEKEQMLFLIDINFFHLFVESLGYEFSNHLLVKFAQSLTNFFGDKATIARLHSDVFAVYCEAGRYSINEVSSQCSRPLYVDGQSIRLGVTIGAASTENQAVRPNLATLIRQSELALNVAKEQKRGSGELFNEELESDSRKNLTLMHDLRLGLDKNELFLLLQPKVDIEQNKICGYEALIRWQHPKKGLVPPDAFIPAVEKSGLNYDLDIYVAKKLVEIFSNHPNISEPVSINISANSLNHDDFAPELINVFKANNISPSRVEIEVTENALIHSSQAISHLKELHDAGFVICLDDFGAGFSSLAYLSRLPLHIIKIDRSFVAELNNNAESLILLKGMTEIIRNLQKQIVIEGVETDEQLTVVKELNINTVQGYYYFKPMPVVDAEQLDKQLT